MGAKHAAPEQTEERAAARASPRGAEPLLVLRAAAGNRAFGQVVRAALQRSPESEALHKVGVDDTWLADRLQAGALGTAAEKRSIELRFFPGKTTRRALVTGGSPRPTRTSRRRAARTRRAGTSCPRTSS